MPPQDEEPLLPQDGGPMSPQEEGPLPPPDAGPLPVNRGRKRRKLEDLWKKNQTKKKRNSGKEYVGRTGKSNPEKSLPVILEYPCTSKCHETIDREQCQRLMKTFWDLGEYAKQNLFLKGLLHKRGIDRVRPTNSTGKAKTGSFQYFLQNENDIVRVCKTFFLMVFQISWGRLYRIISKETIAEVSDKRGKETHNKIDDRDVVEHINSFPKFQSHYLRKDNPDRKYLHPYL